MTAQPPASTRPAADLVIAQDADTVVSANDPVDGPLPLRIAVLLLWIEAVALGLLAAVELVKIVTGTPEDMIAAVLLGVMIAGTAALTAKIGSALTYRRAWARGAGLVLQLSALPVAWFMIGGEGNLATRIGGLVIAAICVSCSALLFARSTSRIISR